jgi:hypothetical protein
MNSGFISKEKAHSPTGIISMRRRPKAASGAKRSVGINRSQQGYLPWACLARAGAPTHERADREQRRINGYFNEPCM